jgi:hypothetical protein
MITVRCTCGETYHADEHYGGRRIRCKCGKFLEIVAVPNPRDLVGSQERSGSSSIEPSDRPAEAYWRRTRKALPRLWAVAVSVSGILLLSWGVYRIANPPQEKNSSASLRSTPLAVPAPVATVQPMPLMCAPEAQVRPRSGAELGGRHRGGFGRLQVANGTEYDAVAGSTTTRQSPTSGNLYPKQGIWRHDVRAARTLSSPVPARVGLAC